MVSLFFLWSDFVLTDMKKKYPVQKIKVSANQILMFRLGNPVSLSTRNSRNFPVLFASDDEDNNPFLSPTSNCSIQIRSNGVSNIQRAKVTELDCIDHYYFWIDNRRWQGMVSDHRFSISTLMRMEEVIIRISNLFLSHSLTLVLCLTG